MYSPSALDLGSVLVEGAEVLHGGLQALVEELHVVHDVLVVGALLLQDRQLFQDLALDHGDAVLFGYLKLQIMFSQSYKVL